MRATSLSHASIWSTLFIMGGGARAAFVLPRQGHALQRVEFTDLQMSVPSPLDTLSSGLASIARLPYGVTVAENAKDSNDQVDTRILVLYDIENSPACRSVRERITELDLVVENVVPATENSRVFQDPSSKYYLVSGATVPRMIVSLGNKETTINGASDIISFLDGEFSISSDKQMTASEDAEEMKEAMLSALDEPSNYLATFLRAGRGANVCSAADSSKTPRPEKPLILYSYEGNQFCRLVREVLTELDIAYQLRSVGKKSPRRTDMAEITGGSTQCPYLIDENTGERIFESADIVRYLYKTYALFTPPSEILQAASSIVTPLLKPIYKYLAPIQAGSGGDDKDAYEMVMAAAKKQIQDDISSAPVVVYTYSLSPFCSEATALLDNLGITYKEISLGKEWLPGFISEEGAKKRAALGEMTGQTSLPHVFIGSESIGGLFTGTPGLVPSLEKGTLNEMVDKAEKK